MSGLGDVVPSNSTSSIVTDDVVTDDSTIVGYPGYHPMPVSTAPLGTAFILLETTAKSPTHHDTLAENAQYTSTSVMLTPAGDKSMRRI